MMEKDAKIYVAGHRGMVGSAICRELRRQGYTNIITRTHSLICAGRMPSKHFFRRKNRRMFFWRRQRSVEYKQIRKPLPTLCTKI